ncbi:MAG: AI-2E family transporter [Cystobacterineae bacterium]|nr:AI-2E family transporter [Cystobacterineae bacterium]
MPSFGTSAPEGFSEQEEGIARRADWIWIFGVLGILAMIFGAITYIKVVAIPALLAFALAYALNPLIRFMCQKGFSRLVAVIVIFAGFLGLLLGFIFYLIPVLKAQFLKIPESFSRAGAVVVPWLEKLETSIPEGLHGVVVSLREGVVSLVNELGPALAQLVGSIASSTPGIMNVLIGIGLLPILIIVFLLKWNALVQRLMLWIPEWARAQVTHRFRELNEVLSGFVRGQLLVGCILTVCYAIGFSLARIDMAILIALVAGFGNILPYVGTASGITLASIALLLSSSTGWWQVFGVVITFVVAQILEGFFITPRIVGNRVGLPATVVIVSVFTFGELFGFMGILLSVPVTAVLRVVLKLMLLRYREVSWYAKG